MSELNIERINELARKAKTEGLTEAEKEEQAVLRKNYIENFRRGLRAQLNNIDIQEPDGTITNLGEKYGSKENN